MGATLGGAFAVLASMIWPGLPLSVPAFAMVGMGTMVGSATGAALSAVASDLRDDPRLRYRALLDDPGRSGGPSVRRMLSRENIYTMKPGAARPSDSKGSARQYVPGARR